MSSTPKRKAPPVEQNAPKQPLITPQVLGVIFLVLIIIAAVFTNSHKNKLNAQISQLEGSKSTLDAQIQTYKKKGGKLDSAKRVNQALREKLGTLDYLFLSTQDDIIPFWEDTFAPMILESGYLNWTGESKVIADEYRFNINMAMSPFKSIPKSVLFEDAPDVFPIVYLPESNGNPVSEPVDSRVGSFLMPYNITVEKLSGTYEDVQRLVRSIQQGTSRKMTDKLFTVHCIMTDGDPSNSLIRRTQQWTMRLTVYFINPEKAASGDSPPDPPGAYSC